MSCVPGAPSFANVAKGGIPRIIFDAARVSLAQPAFLQNIKQIELLCLTSD
jgi:hypothetical protein